jgi:hypothetical protein
VRCAPYVTYRLTAARAASLSAATIAIASPTSATRRRATDEDLLLVRSFLDVPCRQTSDHAGTARARVSTAMMSAEGAHTTIRPTSAPSTRTSLG